ncbi:hypothetical protein MMAD_23030 [Mycolicibacterium madagascariense]|uniref:Uncharacterized protein n=1 Tax=Mycolicibacterium madagascariense TaxID=212765 RepID=A0A7I7XFP8_9MYCO|nr:hypothetical protein [Mycolicibacterium madagascariense]MCV7013952.1 hypothetical protein [Mycolicibacterium madagascariense]BBZ28008.1 hypothetical protein MMAD_23030 [Mycolicibacterium madagascariense]
MNLRQLRPQGDPGALATFGMQYQTPDGATVIPVARPPGVFVIKDGIPRWQSATDDTRIALFGILVGLVATAFAGIAMVIRPPWPDLHGDVSRRS